MADPFKAKAYGEHVIKTTGQTISAADYVQQAQVGAKGTIRNKAIDPKLEKILAQVAAETGITFVVGSGGQDAKGTPNARRTGSTRHDKGGAADVMAKGADGKFIDFSTPAGQKQWSDVVTRARSLGATGIGAGPDYMGTQTVHIGFGSPAKWSSAKSGQPVEKWLAAAYDAGAKMPPGTIPSVASSLDVTRSTQAPVPMSKPAQLAALTQAGFKPGKDPVPAIMAFQAKNGLKVDGIIGKNTTAALGRVTAAKQAAPSPVVSRSAAVAPPSAARGPDWMSQGPDMAALQRVATAGPVSPSLQPGMMGRGQPAPVGSAFQGGWGSNGFNLPGMNANVGSATGGDWGSMAPLIAAAGQPSNTLPLDANLNAFNQPVAVASAVDIGRAPKIVKPYKRAASGRSAASVGETFDSVWAEASGQ